MEDVLLVTILNSNIDELKYQCLSNKQALGYCQSNDFWINKFKHDKLPLFTTHNTINQWIDEYKLMQKYKYQAQDILMINKIESERLIDTLNVIVIAFTISTYPLIKNYFDVDDYQDNHIYGIMILNHIDHYEMIYHFIDIDTDEVTGIKKSTNYNEILNLIISVLYIDPNAEILDALSYPFIITTDTINWEDDAQRIGYKRLGIRDTLVYI